MKLTHDQFEQLNILIEELEDKTLQSVLMSFSELLVDHQENLDENLSLLWDLLGERPDLILEKLETIQYVGLIKAIKLHKNPKRLEIVSYLNSGFGKNWDGSGCENKPTATISNIEQTVSIKKDYLRYSNRHNITLKFSELPSWSPHITLR